MADNARIEDLRRRVQKDPASIAFAQLAEECRRAGQYEDAVAACRAGLAIHPGYLSARVTLGRALLELNQLSEGQAELEIVLASAPENLAAIRGLAEILHRLGDKTAALAQYRAALALARNDPDLERTVSELSREIEPRRPAAVADGMSFEQIQTEFLKHTPQPAPPPKPAPAVTESRTLPDSDGPAKAAHYQDAVAASPEARRGEAGHYRNAPAAADDGAKALALRQIAALEEWRDAIHVVRTQRGS